MRPAPPPAVFQPGRAPPPAEIIAVDEHRVACDGGGGALGHPRVWMEMGDSGYVECGYCDRRFVLTGHAHAEDPAAAPADWQGSGGN